jgi:hypothetical protein
MKNQLLATQAGNPAEVNGGMDLLKEIEHLVQIFEENPDQLNSFLIYHLRGLTNELFRRIIVKPYQLSEDGATSLTIEERIYSLRYRIAMLSTRIPYGK